MKKTLGKILAYYIVISAVSVFAADTFSLSAALQKKQSDIVIPPGKHTVSVAEIPANTVLRFRNGAMLEIPEGKKLAVKGMIDAGRYQIFSGKGIVTGGAKVDTVYPEWFGAGIKEKADSSEAIQKAVDFATSAARINKKVRFGEYVPKIDLGRGVFYLSKGIKATTQLKLIGDGASLQPLPGFPEYEFALHISLLKIGKDHTSGDVYISGLRFGAFSNAIYVDTKNADRSSVIIEQCRFHYVGEQFYKDKWADKTYCSPDFKYGAAIFLDSQSTLNRISDCYFNSCHRVLYVKTGDYVVFDNSWISTRPIIQGENIKGLRYSPIVNRAFLIMRDVMGIPQQRGTPEKRVWHPTLGKYRKGDYYPGHPSPYLDKSVLYADQAENAWISNYRKVICDNVRFGGEFGGFCAVNNYARWNKFNYCSVVITNSELCHEFNEPTIRLFEIPFMISVRDNTYLRNYSEGKEFEVDGQKYKFKIKLIDFAPSLTAEKIQSLKKGRSHVVRTCNAKIRVDNNPPEWYLGDFSPESLVHKELHPFLNK